MSELLDVLIDVTIGSVCTRDVHRRSAPLSSHRRRLALATAFFAVVAPEIAIAGTTYYVSTAGGNDSNAGTSVGAAFATIQHCANSAAPGDTCRVRSGTYRETITPPTSGTASAPITFMADGNGVVTVDGADPVTSSWSVVSSSDMTALESSDSRLSSSPMASAVASGLVYRTQAIVGSNLSTDQLFIDGVMANIAQWPVPGSDLSHETLGHPQSVSNLTINDSAITQQSGYWTGTPIWANAWFVSATSTVASSSVGSITLSSFPTSCVGLGSGGRGNRYRLYGSLEALSAANQWFYNTSTGTLYLWLAAGDTPSAHAIEAKSRQLAFDLSNVSYVNVRGLSIFSSTIQTGASSTGNGLDHLTLSYVSHYTDLAPDPVQLSGDTVCPVITAGETTSGVVLNGTGNTLSDSTIAYSAGNGVVTLGSGNTVAQNYIHDTDYAGSYAAAIQAIGSGQTIEYNTVYDSGRSALTVDNHTNGSSWHNNRIAYNDFYSTGYLSNDNGPLYVCCSLDMTSTRIDHNWTHDDDRGEDGYGGIYIDNYSSNATVDHNAIWDMSQNGMIINGGTGNQVINNTLQGLQYGMGASSSNNTVLNNLLTSTSGQFVNAPAHDYRLAGGTSAIDIGSTDAPLTNDYFGSAPDQGAYEYGGPWWLGGCTVAQCWPGKTGSQGVSTAVYDAVGATLSSGLSPMTDQTGTTDGSYVAITTTGESAAFNVTSSAGGAVALRIRYSTAAAGAVGSTKTLSLYLNGTKSQQLSFPTTTSASDWAFASVTATLAAGTDTVTVRADSTDTAAVNLDSLVVSVVNTPATSTIQAESYTVQSGTSTLAGGSGTVVGGINGGSWLEYANVDFGSSGLNQFQASVAEDPAYAGKQIAIHLDSLSGTVIGTATIASTGGWYTYATQTTSIIATTGVHNVYLVAVGSGSGFANIDWLTFTVRAMSTIQAEGYTAQSGTSTLAGGSGTVVGGINGGSWLEYANVDFGGSGLNQFQASVAEDPAYAGKQIAIHLDSLSGTVIGTATIASTDGWYTYATQTTPIIATTGVHNVYFVSVGSGGGFANIDWFTFNLAPTTISATSTIQAENYTAQNGTSTFSGGSGMVVGNINVGSWLEYANVDFGSSGLNEFQASVAEDPANAGKQIAIHLDSLTGPVIGTATIASTGGWYTYATEITLITATTGVHNVYLDPVGSGNGFANIDWFTFL